MRRTRLLMGGACSVARRAELPGGSASRRQAASGRDVSVGIGGKSVVQRANHAAEPPAEFRPTSYELRHTKFKQTILTNHFPPQLEISSNISPAIFSASSSLVRKLG